MVTLPTNISAFTGQCARDKVARARRKCVSLTRVYFHSATQTTASETLGFGNCKMLENTPVTQSVPPLTILTCLVSKFSGTSYTHNTVQTSPPPIFDQPEQKLGSIKN